MPFIPDESELDSLISACRSRRMAAYLQCLKETYANPGEVLRLKWVNITNNIVTINTSQRTPSKTARSQQQADLHAELVAQDCGKNLSNKLPYHVLLL